MQVGQVPQFHLQHHGVRLEGVEGPERREQEEGQRRPQGQRALLHGHQEMVGREQLHWQAD